MKHTGSIQSGTRSAHRWSQRITETSHALDLQKGVFAGKDPKAIARSLKHSADSSHSRKSSPFRSAMSMLTFYINRAGKKLAEEELSILENAKEELRKIYSRKSKKHIAK